MQLYLDCDGVLADFDAAGEVLFGMPPREYEAKVGEAAYWKNIENVQEGFYTNLKPCVYAYPLYNIVCHMKPIILTATPRGDWAKNQKLRWRDKYFPNVPMVVCKSSEKSKWCKPGDVLIDDREKYKLNWECAGGFFLTYKDEQKTYEEVLTKLWSLTKTGY